MEKEPFDNRVTVGFTKEQMIWLTDQVREKKAESISQLIRSLVNDKILEAKQFGKEEK